MGTVANKKLVPKDAGLPLWVKAAGGFAAGVLVSKAID
jgi:hypothetical protein